MTQPKRIIIAALAAMLIGYVVGTAYYTKQAEKEQLVEVWVCIE